MRELEARTGRKRREVPQTNSTICSDGRCPDCDCSACSKRLERSGGRSRSRAKAAADEISKRKITEITGKPPLEVEGQSTAYHAQPAYGARPTWLKRKEALLLLQLQWLSWRRRRRRHVPALTNDTWSNGSDTTTSSIV